jgi:hypothetical protein
MGWKNWPVWLKGGVVTAIIGLFLSVINYLAIILLGELGAYTPNPFLNIGAFIFLDYFLLFLDFEYSFILMSLLGTLIGSLIVIFICLLFDKKVSLTKKSIFFIILFLIVVPLPAYSNYAKANDHKIINENNGLWQVSDQKICDRMSIFSKYAKEDCYVSVLNLTKDILICDKFVTSFRKDQCYFDIAISTITPNNCDKIESDNYRDDCYSSISSKTHDSTLCDKMRIKLVEKDNCYLHIAIAKKELTVCEKISNIDTKESCVRCFTDPKIQCGAA